MQHSRGLRQDQPVKTMAQGWSALSPRRQRAVGVILLAAIVIVAAVLSDTRGGPAPLIYGQAVSGESLAEVHVGQKNIYLPGVTCSSCDPGVVIVSLGKQDEPIAFFLAAFLGPQASDGKYLSPRTVLVTGHRGGVAFNQTADGSVSVSAEMQNQLRASRPTSAITAGTASFLGTDASRERLTGTVRCGA